MILRDVSIEIQERIENWAVWCIERMPRHTCRSIEGRWKNNAPGEPPSFIVNPLDAVIIERAMIGLDDYSKRLIKYHYVLHRPVNEVRRKFDIRYGQYESEIARALRMVEDRLRAMKCCWI